MASGIAGALASDSGTIAHLAEEGFVPTEIALLLRSSSLEEREARCRDIDLAAVLEASGAKARIIRRHKPICCAQSHSRHRSDGPRIASR